MAKLTVAFQGEMGAYGWEAIRSRFGPEAIPVPCRTFRETFEAVLSGQADRGLVPVENSQAGSINEVYDLLGSSGLTVAGEICHRVDLCLMALPGQTLGDLKKVVSHPVALAQCEPYLRRLGVEIEVGYDTAGSAKQIREGNLVGVGAVAGKGAAEVYGLTVLAERIQTVQENFTRFVEIRRGPVEAQAGPQKTMLCLTLDHKPGALYRALGVFAERGINLLKLESRPSRERPWEYRFYLDVAGAPGEGDVGEALVALQEVALRIQILGSFTRDLGCEV
jgi:prephenate dehydratase